MGFNLVNILIENLFLASTFRYIS